ncbi:hypothetical protein HDU87_002335, partial [Geranomyces variabilis]
MTQIKPGDKILFHKFLQALFTATEQDAEKSERRTRKLPGGVQYTLYDPGARSYLKANFFHTKGTIQLQPSSPKYMATLLAWFK